MDFKILNQNIIENQFLIKILVGDTSADGHGHTDSSIIISNIKSYQIRDAYQRGSAKIGVNLELLVTNSDDEEYVMLSKDKLRPLIDHELLEEKDFDEEENTAIHISADLYIHLWLQIAQKGNAEFVYTRMDNKMSELDLGGYWLAAY